MRQENNESVLWSPFARPSQIMCLEIMGIIDPGDPQRIRPAPDFCRFIQKDRKTIALELQDHFKRIVVPEDAPAIG